VLRPGPRRFAVLATVSLTLTCGAAAGAPSALAADSPEGTSVRTQSFAANPGWEGSNNRVAARGCPITVQDFGWRAGSDNTGGRPGEIGGRFDRSLTSSSFAEPIRRATLQQPLSASGVITLTEAQAQSGVLFGWFNSQAHDWRTPNSLAFRLDGQEGHAEVFSEYATRGSLAAGQQVGSDHKPLRLRPGRPHRWRLRYDPAGAGGLGEVVLSISGAAPARLPLGPGHKLDGATFDRFGFLGQQIPGKSMNAYVDDVRVGRTRHDFDRGPEGFRGHGNHARFEDCRQQDNHDFGFDAAEGGRLGGLIWRTESSAPSAFYADPVESLSMDDELFASGTVALRQASSDSASFLGWFNRSSVGADNNRLGIEIEGPSRVGQWFKPTYNIQDQGEGGSQEGPLKILPDGRVHTWSVHYVPQQDNVTTRRRTKLGVLSETDRTLLSGVMIVTLDGQTVELPINEEDRRSNATFDAFGMRTVTKGGHSQTVFYDNLTYTAVPAGR